MFSLDKQHCNVYPNVLVHVHVHVHASLYCHREYTMCSWCHTILLSLYTVYNIEFILRWRCVTHLDVVVLCVAFLLRYIHLW